MRLTPEAMAEAKVRSKRIAERSARFQAMVKANLEEFSASFNQDLSPKRMVRGAGTQRYWRCFTGAMEDRNGLIQKKRIVSHTYEFFN